MRFHQHLSLLLLPLVHCDGDADSQGRHSGHSHATVSVGGHTHSYGHGQAGSAVQHGATPAAAGQTYGVATPVAAAQTYGVATPVAAQTYGVAATFPTPSQLYGTSANSLPPVPLGQSTTFQLEDDCTVSYELSCPTTGYSGPGNSLLNCPAGEKEICLDVFETECNTVSKKECRDYEETNCEIQSNEICINADQTSCHDTTFTPSTTTCRAPQSEPQCQEFETQVCDDPKPEQVCAELSTVTCTPETFTICKTVVSTTEKEECLEFKEPECKEYTEQMCYNGYSAGDCRVTTEEECHYVTKPCPYNAQYGCQPTKERVCNQISKPKCTGAGASVQCTTLTNQRCTVTPITSCINVPVVAAQEVCETKTINSCTEVPARECLTVFKTECSKPKQQKMCVPPAAQECVTEDLPPLTNRVCEGQNKEICFNTDRTVCTNDRRQHCYDIPITTCEKKFEKKCFKVPTPPQLVQVPKYRCRNRKSEQQGEVGDKGHNEQTPGGGRQGGGPGAGTGGYGYTYGK